MDIHVSADKANGVRKLLTMPLAGVHYAKPLFVITFDRHKFCPTAYIQSGIEYPLGIQQSVTERQAEYYFGRLAARCAMDYMQCPLANIGTGASRQPLWPRGYVGSITHTSEMAAAIVLPAGLYSGVGIDIEQIGLLDEHTALSSGVISSKEYTMILSASQTLPIQALLTTIFSAKESLFKGIFHIVGRYFDFDAVTLTQVDLARKCIILEMNEDLCEEFQRGSTFKIDFRMIGTHSVLSSLVW